MEGEEEKGKTKSEGARGIGTEVGTPLINAIANCVTYIR
jgi:hypothetical protein